jgi:hypothetical protein
MQKLPNANALLAPILLWDDLSMTSEDDPEARIRELEQPLADAARASEASPTPPPGKWAAPPVSGFPPPSPGPAFPPPSPGSAFPPPPPGPTFPPPPTYGGQSPWLTPQSSSSNRVWWIVAGVFVIGMIALPLGILAFTSHQISHSGITTLGPNPTVIPTVAAPSGGMTPAPSAMPTAPATSAPAAVPTAPVGASLEISGIDVVRTVACNNSVIHISGITNQVTITGHCASVHVSGSKNAITVDASDAIEVSGIENQITYHTGTPSVEQSGIDNVIKQG